jgi:hypothetical protein
MCTCCVKGRGSRRQNVYCSIVAFGPCPWWQSPACGPPNERMKRNQATELAPSQSSATIPFSKLLVSDSLRGCNSYISEAKNACADYTSESLLAFLSSVLPVSKWCDHCISRRYSYNVGCDSVWYCAESG